MVTLQMSLRQRGPSRSTIAAMLLDAFHLPPLKQTGIDHRDAELQAICKIAEGDRYDALSLTIASSHRGLTTFDLLFVMELKTRRVNFAGCTTHPNEARMNTIARELTNREGGFLTDKKYLIMDGDARSVSRFVIPAE